MRYKIKEIKELVMQLSPAIFFVLILLSQTLSDAFWSYLRLLSLYKNL